MHSYQCWEKEICILVVGGFILSPFPGKRGRRNKFTRVVCLNSINQYISRDKKGSLHEGSVCIVYFFASPIYILYVRRAPDEIPNAIK